MSNTSNNPMVNNPRRNPPTWGRVGVRARFSYLTVDKHGTPVRMWHPETPGVGQARASLVGQVRP